MKILVIDDHALIREAVRHVVAQVEGVSQVLVAGDCEAGLRIAEECPELDLVLLDFQLRGLSGIDAIRAWRSRHPAIPLVALSAFEDRATILAAMSAGVSGYIPKSSSNAVLVAALQLVLSGGRYLPSELLQVDDRSEMRGGGEARGGEARGGEARGGEARGAGETRGAGGRNLERLGLSERQFQVFEAIVAGKPNKVIANELGIAERTVKAHITDVMRVLGVRNRTQAAIAGARLGLVANAPGGPGAPR